MDPNATLATIREELASHRDAAASESDGDLRLIEAVEALDEWLSKGGFLPAEWASPPIGRLYVARGVKVILDSDDPDIGAEEFELDVLVNHWPDGTSTTALQQSRVGHWYVPGALVEESGG